LCSMNSLLKFPFPKHIHFIVSSDSDNGARNVTMQKEIPSEYHSQQYNRSG